MDHGLLLVGSIQLILFMPDQREVGNVLGTSRNVFSKIGVACWFPHQRDRCWISFVFLIVCDL